MQLSNPARWRMLDWWYAIAIATAAIQCVLALFLKQSFFLAAYTNISYFLLLLVASGIAAGNAVRSRQAIRLFWLFLAVGCALWALSASFWVDAILRAKAAALPDISLSNPPLFLHGIFFMAAVVACPHLSWPTRKLYRTTLRYLLVLFFWVFVYAFLQLPYRHRGPEFNRYSILYFTENIVLLAALGWIIARVHGPWRRLYWHFLGSSALYSIASLANNIATSRSGYTGGLYDVPLFAAVCWLIWVTTLGSKTAHELREAVQLARDDRPSVSLLAMLAVVAIPAIGVWELFRPDEPNQTREIRLLIVLLSVLFLSVCVFVEESLANRGLSSDVGQANERFRLAAHAGKMYAYEWDVATDRVIRSEEHVNVLGFGDQSKPLTRKEILASVHQDERMQLVDSVAEATPENPTIRNTYSVVRPDGSVIWLEKRARAFFDRQGKMLRMVGMVADITERKRAEEALRESEERLRVAAEVGRMYAWEWDPATDSVLRSAEAAGIVGPSAATPEAKAKDYFSSIHPDDRDGLWNLVNSLTPEVPIYRTQYRRFHPDGTLLWLEESGYATFDKQGKMLRLVGMTADVTVRKQAEESLANVSRRLIEAEEKERTRISRELHDDIGQRLALLSNGLEQLQHISPNLPVEVRSLMDELLKQTYGIATDVQSLSHELHSSKLEILGMGTAMRSFCREFSEHQKVEVDFETHDLPRFLPGTISLCLFRVLQEALRNAAKHSSVRHFEVRSWATPDEIHLTVGDSGAGFELEAARNGQGLGLTSMEERLKLLKGTFSIKSQPQGGTTIHACVPFRLGDDSMLTVA